MLKSFICFLGLCSLTHASIDGVSTRPEGTATSETRTLDTLTDAPSMPAVLREVGSTPVDVNIMRVPQGREGLTKPTCVVPDPVEELNAQLGEISSMHIYVGLDGTIKYFIPDKKKVAKKS